MAFYSILKSLREAQAACNTASEFCNLQRLIDMTQLAMSRHIRGLPVGIL